MKITWDGQKITGKKSRILSNSKKNKVIEQYKKNIKAERVERI